MIRRWLAHRRCMHHDWRTGQSWIRSELVNMGQEKVFWCEICKKTF